VEIVLQYFDGCPNWREADRMLADVLAGSDDIAIVHQLVETPEAAERLGFHGSPTILIDGVDPFADADAPVGLSCRVYATANGLAGSPSADQLRQALRATGSTDAAAS
jgi:hypothetical protein